MATNLFLLLLAVLFAADAWSTYYILKRGGRELNKPLAWLMGRIGVQQALGVTKVAAFLLVAYYVEQVTPNLQIALLALYVAVVANNLKHVVRIRRA